MGTRAVKEAPADRLFAQNLVRARTARGMSQRALGDAVGLGFQAVHKMEHGERRCSIGEAVLIADVLGVDLAAMTSHGVTVAIG